VEGDYFSGQGLQRSIENIRRLNFFEDVEIQRKKGSADDLLILDVSVKEKPTGTFSFGAGFSSYDKAIGSFSISQNNLFGRGQKLAGSGQIGTKTQDFDIRFTEPWFLERPISAGIDVYKFEREYYNYTRNSLGGAIRFEFPTGIDPYTRGRVRYGYDDANIFDVGYNAAPEIQEMQGKNKTSSITLGLVRNSTDHPWNTTRGSINSFTYEYAGRFLGGDLSYDSYLLGSEWYFSMPWETVFLVKGHWGFMKEKSDGFLPSFKKFRIGGINTVRGFDFATISPLDPVTLDYIGGTKMMYYNFEYRIPLLKDQGVVGLVFFDAGNVFTENESWTFSGIRRAVGGGFRWYSPAGPVRVEWGYNLDPFPWEKNSVVDFTMGGTF
jgi:outer membrane protein insertion porin family